MKETWGGIRAGSGRRVIPDKMKKKGYTFQLDEEDIEFIETFEGKNRSESLRNMINEYKILKKRFVFSRFE